MAHWGDDPQPRKSPRCSAGEEGRIDIPPPEVPLAVSKFVSQALVKQTAHQDWCGIRTERRVLWPLGKTPRIRLSRNGGALSDPAGSGPNEHVDMRSQG
jgi:hypothetical protein